MSKILLVEDDSNLAQSIMIWLKAQQHVVEHVVSGRDALELILNASYEVVILDWDIPGIDGLEVCQRLRAADCKVPILMLTGKDTVDCKVTGLDAGVDDYLAKPFSLKELSSRLRAVTRRSGGNPSNLLKVQDISLDAEGHRVTRAGEEIKLMPREFAVLEFLMSNKNQVFSTDTLLQRLWHTESEVTPDAVRACIKRLRKKIDGDCGEENSIIETVPKVGYRLRQF